MTRPEAKQLWSSQLLVKVLRRVNGWDGTDDRYAAYQSLLAHDSGWKIVNIEKAPDMPRQYALLGAHLDLQQDNWVRVSLQKFECSGVCGTTFCIQLGS